MSMKHLTTLLLATILLGSCRKEITILESTSETIPTYNLKEVGGLYLLNQGNMGSNKATLDFLDYNGGVYHKNIFAQINPSVVYELGDVGNDIQLYDSRLYAVINCSNLIEVMDAATAKHIGSITITSPRYITFKGDYGYVSSYDGNIYKIDLEQLTIEATCAVGREPEGVAIVEDRLYVANSGGYKKPSYETTVSVIELSTFTVSQEIEVGTNPNQLITDNSGQIWVSVRGDYDKIESETVVIDCATNSVTKSLDIPNSAMCYSNGYIYLIGTVWSGGTTIKGVAYYKIDAATKMAVDSNFIKDGSEYKIELPYNIAVNPENSEILITDAGNYVTSGKLYCYSSSGELQWRTTTGDIPAAITFTPIGYNPFSDETIDPDNSSNNDDAYITEVFEYMPAPGQHVNTLPKYEEGDTQETMNAKALQYIKGTNGGLVSLGGFGGYIVFGFGDTVDNVVGKCDFRVMGNGFTGSSEPGAILVMRDENENGLPDDIWYEIKGSEYDNSTIYTKTYDSSSNFAQWSSTQKSFTGRRLPDNGVYVDSQYVLNSYDFGYADNYPNNDDGSAIDIAWAIDSDGNNAELSGIDFVKVYTAVDQTNGTLGECSTDITGAVNLHKVGISIASQN